MQTDQLVAFVEARLQEDELWALAASAPDSWRGDIAPIPTGVRWTWAVGDDWEPYEIDPLEEHIGESVDAGSPTLVTVDEWPYPEPQGRRYGFRHDVISYAEEVRTADGAHIARHDPARVLREVEAKRRMLAAHPIEYSRVSDFTDCAACMDVDTYDAYPCLTVRLLALPFADHPEYRAEWGVDHG